VKRSGADFAAGFVQLSPPLPLSLLARPSLVKKKDR
jgi:hypothetical protein